jgi:molybdopterin synthase catalytic subunit
MSRRILRIEDKALDPAAEIAALAIGADSGALVTFTGLCRDEGGTLSALEIECYPEMAEAEIGRVIDDAEHRWPLTAVLVIHRHGLIRAGEPIVLVATASTHRTEAFHAAEFLMDYLKTRAPFWKKQHGIAGRSGDWVAATDEDESAAARWISSTRPVL